MSRNDLFVMAESFFALQVARSSEGLRELMRYDTLVQFDVTDGEPFTMKVKNGKINFKKGKARNLELTDISLEASSEVLKSMMRGELSPTRAWLTTDLYVPDFPCKWPLVSWIMTLLRIGADQRSESP